VEHDLIGGVLEQLQRLPLGRIGVVEMLAAMQLAPARLAA
jgi:hypothetical protein